MPERELARLKIVNRFLQLNVSRDQELQQIVELAARILDAPVAMITIMDNETQHIKYKVGTDLERLPLPDTFCQFTIREEQLLIIPDATADERVMTNPFVCKNPNVRFYAGAPLRVHGESNVGTLCVLDVRPKFLTAIQEKMLHRLSRQITQLLEFEASIQLLKEQYEYSLQEETKLRSFFESSSSCHLLLDKELKVLAFNKALVDTMATTYRVELKEGAGVESYVEPTFLTEFTSNCRRALHGETIGVESVVQSPDGPMDWYITYEPAYDGRGNITGISYSATDISQTIRGRKIVDDQEESFRRIDEVLTSELQLPLDRVLASVKAMRADKFPNHVPEFAMFDQAVQELEEKRKLIFPNHV